MEPEHRHPLIGRSVLRQRIGHMQDFQQPAIGEIQLVASLGQPDGNPGRRGILDP